MIFVYRNPETNLMTTSDLEPENVYAIAVEDDELDISTVYIQDGKLLPVPTKPSAFHWFDPLLGEWIDDRNPSEVFLAARAAANMSRSDFLLAAIGAGIIQPSDAGPAARGEIPPSLAPVFASLDPNVVIEAEVRWSAATMIERTNPILAALAEAMAIPDAQLDALFGIPPLPIPNQPGD